MPPLSTPAPRFRLCAIAAIAAAALPATPALACIVGTNSITATRDLAFGAILSGPSGTVTVAPTQSGAQASGAVTLEFGQFAQATSAEFTVCSVTDVTASFTLPSSTSMIGPGNSAMSVTGFTANPTATGSPPSGSIAVTALGQATLRVGATLNVGADQPAGNYAGTFAVTVNYP